ncbi:MAG TPA: serine/threonine-protein kinase [Clostridia bacterium]|nr:serine/threonine-protein kinase [Clostridia bacterium]
MAGSDKTVFDSGATVRENVSTVYEGDTTIKESSATVPDGGTTLLDAALSDAADRTGEVPKSNDSIVKGAVILDTYTVETDAIEGGMGSVWRVHHKGWNVDLAMKRPQPQCFSTEKSKADFIHECEAWISLGLHPNIVSCYYVREIGGTPTIFSEWMDGGSLESAIHKDTLYAGSEAEQQERLLDIAIQFARGLHYAHEAGLIHQDVKPDNLLLTKEGEAKVADFGLAKARAVLTQLEGAPTMNESAGQSPDMDGGKTIMSPSGAYTPAYCSMEQMDGKELTRRTDIYSWAVSVMEMYCGSRLWTNGVVAGLNCRGYFEQTRIPMSEALKELLEKCLAAEPENRPHDFTEIEARLHEIYKAEMGIDYPRRTPKAAADTADSLNNRALSMLDLGKPDEAKKLWGKSLSIYPDHVPSVYNHLIHQWFDCAIDDLEVITRLKRLNQNLNTPESAGALRLAMACRGVDEYVTSISYDAENKPQSLELRSSHPGRRCTDVSGKYDLEAMGSKATLWENATGRCIHQINIDLGNAVGFLHYDAAGHTALFGIDPKFGIPSSVVERPGSMRLFDMHTGRCVRTLAAGVSEELPIRNQKDHMFGSAKLAPDAACYFYPDYYNTTIRYRRPCMTIAQPQWLLCRVQSYAGAQESQRILQSMIGLAKEKLAQMQIADSIQAMNKGYDAAAGNVPEELRRLNAEVGRYCRISGIRTITSADHIGEPPDERQISSGKTVPIIEIENPESTSSRKYPFIEIWSEGKKKRLHRIPLKNEIAVYPSFRFSPDFRILYCVAQRSKQDVYNYLYTIDISSGEVAADQFQISGNKVWCVSPDGHIVVTGDYRGLSFYSLADGKRIANCSINDKDSVSMGYLRGVCYRPDGRAVFAHTNNHAIVMVDLQSMTQYVVREDELVRPGDDKLGNWLYKGLSVIGNGSVVCSVDRLAKLPFDYTQWSIDYAYEFPGFTDWNEDARPYLEIFLALHPGWSDADFNALITELQNRGFGYIRPEGVRNKLKEMQPKKKSRGGLFSRRI